jgi:hypothetical protein
LNVIVSTAYVACKIIYLKNYDILYTLYFNKTVLSVVSRNNCLFFVLYRAYFIAVAFSGIFAVTFSIVFAYVADCTNESERSCSYGLVSLSTCLVEILILMIVNSLSKLLAKLKSGVFFYPQLARLQI